MLPNILETSLSGRRNADVLSAADDVRIQLKRACRFQQTVVRKHALIMQHKDGSPLGPLQARQALTEHLHVRLVPD
ncbi:hypothetical protein [Paenibacillus elgii]|uniref:hypothetical protein n=1 Tax=Paenibacillus elgii TaxID=189691 RepID=UPI002041095C|nr:hypothetical protein [Paenibacillus elgii]MCM3274076.1 hypothetical protein [Paenibacillus elgii]